MQRTVLFTGAGCSRAFGYPTVGEILPLVIEGIKKQTLFAEAPEQLQKHYCHSVQQLLEHLSPGMSSVFNEKTNPDKKSLPQITDLLSQAMYMQSVQQDFVDWNFDTEMPRLKKDAALNERLTLGDITTLLDLAIIEVIYENGNVDKTVLDPLINWIKKKNILKEVKGKKVRETQVSIISTNYDCSVEWNILDEGEAQIAHELIDYGFNWRDVEDGEIYYRLPDAPYKIYKLHGSVDWLKCPRCGFIYINPTQNISSIPLVNKKNNATKCECEYWPLQPVLVTPSYIREYRDSNILQVWRLSLEELRLADEWIIVGYSLPTEDFAIRSLFLRALNGRKKWPKITVIQKGQDSLPKYEQFFGNGRFTYADDGAENYKFT
jgi:NAD-dependent SIR2 family protein deacetylase